MKFDELIVLLPCHGLEDFPTHLEGPAADGILAAWTVLFHPALIAAARSAPVWRRADIPLPDLSNRLVVIPHTGHEQMPEDLAQRTKDEGGLLVREIVDRQTLADAMLAQLDGGDRGIAESLVRDFWALGYCRLQVELLTRFMRYMSNIDERHFERALVSAAESAVEGDEAAAQASLAECFTALYDARKHVYPVDAYLVDITLVAATTAGAALAEEASGLTPMNLLLSAEVARQLSEGAPNAIASVRDAIGCGATSLIGGEASEDDLPLAPLEEVVRSLSHGRAVYQEVFGASPKIFGRRRFGLSAVLPQVLKRYGFTGAWHCTLDDGRFPLGAQCKTRWEGVDGSAIDALCRVPRDASRPESLLDFARRMGDSIDHDQVATLVFAHWPGQTCTWYDDLRRIAQRSPVLGRFVTLDAYFQETELPGRLARFEPDEYRSPYLKQAVELGERDPISRHVIAHRRAAWRQAANTTEALADLVRGYRNAERRVTAVGNDVDQQLSEHINAAAQELAKVLPSPSGAYEGHKLLINSLSSARHVVGDVSDETTNDASDAGMEVPGLGFAWRSASHTPHDSASRDPSTTPRPIAEQNILRNERMEVVVHPETGGIESIYDFRHRDNRLSQQVALRLPTMNSGSSNWHNDDAEPVYTTMVADAIEVTRAGPPVGEITSRGGLLDAAGRRVADFRQSLRLEANSRVLELQIELDPHDPLANDPWRSYYAARFAWSSPQFELSRGVALGCHPTRLQRIEAPEFLEFGDDRLRTTILTGGLPYHQRIGNRMLDSLLIVRGEEARSFRVGIGLDLPQSASAVQEFMTPIISVSVSGDAPESSTAAVASSWLFHVDRRNVVVTHLEVIGEPSNKLPDADNARTSQRVTGFRMRLLETAGRPGAVALRAFRPLARARQVDFAGETLFELPVEEDRIRLNMAAYEWADVEAIWRDQV